MKRKLVSLTKKLLLTSSCLLITALLFSCKTTQKDVQKTEHLSNHYQTKRDSIFIYNVDSVLIEKRGDTVFIDKVKWRYKDRVLSDTVRVTDTVLTIRTDRTVRTEVPRWVWIMVAVAAGIIIWRFRGLFI